MCTYSDTYTNVTTIKVKRSHEFNREQGGTYWRVWRREQKRRNDVIRISKKSQQVFFFFEV